jgi:hypothetical protein
MMSDQLQRVIEVLEEGAEAGRKKRDIAHRVIAVLRPELEDAEIGRRYIELIRHGKHETDQQYADCGCPDAWQELHHDASMIAARQEGNDAN